MSYDNIYFSQRCQVTVFVKQFQTLEYKIYDRVRVLYIAKQTMCQTHCTAQHILCEVINTEKTLLYTEVRYKTEAE